MTAPPALATSSDNLTQELYDHTLRNAIALGYVFPLVSEMRHESTHSGTGKILLLRHDIDTSPRNALRMAKLEHALGVRSSYYVLLHSPFYNPAAPPHYSALRAIADLGFEIGLHYDTQFYEQHGIDSLEGALRDAAALESILGGPIKSVSQHRPASSKVLDGINRYYVDAYNTDLMHDLVYISDSGFKWRGKSLLDLLGRVDRIHALIHPSSWAYAELDMAGTYRQMAVELSAEITEEFERLIASTDCYLRRRAELDLVRKAQNKSMGKVRRHAENTPMPKLAGVEPKAAIVRPETDVLRDSLS